MKSKRRNFTAEFKAQVAIEAQKGQETLAQLSECFNVSSVMISNWKSEFLISLHPLISNLKTGYLIQFFLQTAYFQVFEQFSVSLEILLESVDKQRLTKTTRT